MFNQWGQEISPGDIVGYVSKTGSHTTRKLGVVLSFGERDRYYMSQPEVVALVDWRVNGSYNSRVILEESKGRCGINTLFRLEPSTLRADVLAHLGPERLANA